MLGTINLNDSPLPEDDDDEDNFEQKVKEQIEPPKHIPRAAPIGHEEKSVDILRREREERRQKLKRERPDEKPMYGSHPRPNMNEEPFESRNHRPFDRSKLPQGWLDCPPCGSEIGLLIPSKVPLGETFNDSVLPGRRYSSRQVIRQQRVLGRKIGLVIDLTNTTRYYSVSEWKNEGVKHFKICCKGRDSVPDNESVNQFYFEVVQFIARQKQDKKYILVHCTHGHNRTGYMIVHYLMRTSGISVTQAIKLFADARPPGIYKHDYIDALYKFYHERKPETVIYPAIPEWKRLDLNGEAIVDDDDDDDDNGGPLSPANKNCEMDGVKMTNDDVLGDSIPKEQEEIFRQFCYQTLKMGVGVRGCSQFPGSHPVSLSRDNLQLLRQKYYYATWKADGTRYMMLITTDGCYLVDRNFNFRRVQMRFPLKPVNEALAEKTHNFTLLDGEMIIDTLPDSQKQERRYLIYDMMAINQVSVKELPFCERWKMIEKEVTEPRNIERSRNHYYRYDLEPFRVRRKEFWLLSAVTKLLKEFIPRLSHDADGLVFQGWDDPYVTRTHDSLLKWKYANMNSVDFLFEVIDDRQLLFLHERGKKKLMEGNRVVFTDDSEPASYSGKIVECSWDSEAGVWVCMRIRTDKSTPNDFHTYQKVMQSIRDNITEEILLSEIAETIQLPMYCDRIHKDKLGHQHSMPSRRR